MQHFHSIIFQDLKEATWDLIGFKLYNKSDTACLNSGIINPSMASIRQMCGEVSRGSAGEYQADERAGVARLSWRVSGR